MDRKLDTVGFPHGFLARAYGHHMMPSTDYQPSSSFARKQFFMPDLSSTDAEYFYNKLRTGITDEQVPDRRLHSINFVDDGVRQIVQVGDEDFRGTGPVFAIYGPSHLRNLYFIVTLNAGLVNFDPYWVGATEVQGIESFLDE